MKVFHTMKVFLLLLLFLIILLLEYVNSFKSYSIRSTSLTFLRDKVTSIDVNIVPDSKRRLLEARDKVSSNLKADVIDYDGLIQKVKDHELESSKPDFWDDQQKAQGTLSEVTRLKALIARVDGWRASCDDVEEHIEMAIEEPDEAGKIKVS